MRFSDGISESGARCDVARIVRNFAGRRKQWIRDQPPFREGLEIPAYAKVESKMVGNTNRILNEGGVVVAVGIGCGWPEVLQVVVRHRMGVGPQRREREPGFLWFEGEGIHLNDIEEIFTTLLAGEKIVDPGDKSVAANLDGVAAGIEAEGFGKLGTVFASGSRELIGAPDAIDDVVNLDERVVGVCVGLAQIAGELGPQMADGTRGETGSKRG